jgi:phosphate transport system protein
MNETRKAYHVELDELRSEMIRLGAEVVEKIPRGTEVLLSGDLVAADVLIGEDDPFDEASLALEERCYRMLALQGPVASDLREIVAAVKIVGELERSADLVVNICKAARRIYGHEIDPRLRGVITRMSEQAHLLFRFAVEAYDLRDAPLASALDDMDDELDRLQVELIQAIFTSHAEGRLDLPVAVQLALVARFYERIGDHAVNIGERIRYVVTGSLPEHAPAPPQPPAGNSGQDGSTS